MMPRVVILWEGDAPSIRATDEDDADSIFTHA